MNSITKKCARCGKIKPFWDYYKYSRNKDGLHSYCKQCNSEYEKQRYKEKTSTVKAANKRWAQANPEKCRERVKRYSATHPEKKREYREKHLERERETHQVWYRDNKDKVKERTRQYREGNKERLQAAANQWRKDHPENYKATTHKRLSRIKGSGGVITAKEWRELCEKYGNKCLCCGRDDVKLTLDHVIPIAMGGLNVISNAQPLCQSCNSKKWKNHIDYRENYD
jgi:5-methylcytosine-specific restriction endonuclease McrA